MRGCVMVVAMGLGLMVGCPTAAGPPVDADRLLSTLSPNERTEWCQWRDDTLAVVGADGVVTCTDSISWPAGTVAECAANDSLFIPCEAGAAAECIEATALDPCAAGQPAGCDALDACVAMLPPENGVACSANECSCPNGVPVSVDVELVRYGDTDYCLASSSDQMVCDGAYHTGCY